ncbi:MAG: 30S ribosomal protein S1 [Chloroflexota bacterium]
MSSETRGVEGPEDIQPETSTEEAQPLETDTAAPADPVGSQTDEPAADDATATHTTDAAASGEDAETSDETASEADAEPAAPVPTTVEAKPEPPVSRGDLIEGTIAETSPMSITVDLGSGLTGVVPGRELERMNRSTIEELTVGQPITVYVVNPSDHQGNIILSVNRAVEEMDWQEAETYRKSGDIYEGNIAGYNKGGLIVRFGRLRGFVPDSQLPDEDQRKKTDKTPEEVYGSRVNSTIFVRVLEVDRNRNRLILSERAAAREVRERRKGELIDELNVGQVVEGTVVSLEDFGAFVDVGGAEGLVHLTEISWKHITHPREVLEEGQKVTVEVISIDKDRKRIGLSIKRQEADPWDEVAATYQIGDLVQGVITKMTKFGAFASLVDAEEIEGLVHISELSDDRVAHPREVVNEGEKLTLRVVKIDVKNRRLGLSLKRVNSAEYLDRDMQTFASESDE